MDDNSQFVSSQNLGYSNVLETFITDIFYSTLLCIIGLGRAHMDTCCRSTKEKVHYCVHPSIIDTTSVQVGVCCGSTKKKVNFCVYPSILCCNSNLLYGSAHLGACKHAVLTSLLS